ncbi:MAG: hypothetical protein CMI30_10880 [Opitutae bacterium]|nr:hypothetical protein [Opitutae bacterium]
MHERKTLLACWTRVSTDFLQEWQENKRLLACAFACAKLSSRGISQKPQNITFFFNIFSEALPYRHRKHLWKDLIPLNFSQLLNLYLTIGAGPESG